MRFWCKSWWPCPGWWSYAAWLCPMVFLMYCVYMYVYTKYRLLYIIYTYVYKYIMIYFMYVFIYIYIFIYIYTMFISQSSCWLLLSILSLWGSSSNGLHPLNVRCPNWWTGLGHAWTSKTSFDRNYLLSRSFKSRSQIIPMCFHSIFVAAAVPYKSCPIGSTKIVSHFSLSEQDSQPAPDTTDSWGALREK